MTTILDDLRAKMRAAQAEGARWTTVAIMHNGADALGCSKAARLTDGLETIYLVTVAQWHRVLTDISPTGVVGRLGGVDIVDLRQDTPAAKAIRERIAEVVRRGLGVPADA